MASRESLRRRNGRKSKNARRTRRCATSPIFSSGGSWSKTAQGAAAPAIRWPERRQRGGFRVSSWVDAEHSAARKRRLRRCGWESLRVRPALRHAAGSGKARGMGRFLVTGGCGFIGSHLCDALVAAGHRVRILDDLSTGKRENPPVAAEVVVGDVADAALVKKLFDGIDG